MGESTYIPPLGVRRGRGGVSPGQLYPKSYLSRKRKKSQEMEEWRKYFREYKQRTRPKRMPLAPPDTSPFPGLPRRMRPRWGRRVIV
jgi:hypothetical protein